MGKMAVYDLVTAWMEKIPEKKRYPDACRFLL